MVAVHTMASPEELRVAAIGEVVAALVAGVKDNRDVDLNAVKSAAAKKYALARAPKLVEIIAAVPEEYKPQLLPRLKAKPVRTASGIAVIAVMSKPHRCPHIATTGNICVYCPGGPDSDFEYSTQSYTGYEPTSMRAIRARYDPYAQARGRLDQLRRLGHSVDKVEFILMGGTFMSLPTDYRDYFVRNLHDALSGHSSSSVAEAAKYAEQVLVDLVARVLALIPPWTRVYRIQRDIPMPLVTSALVQNRMKQTFYLAGVEKGNLRELALARMQDLGLKCRDVRTREVGIQGYGTLLMEEAERIARDEHRSHKLAVISGIGTRHYYRRLGYELEGPYMTKLI
eukprot:jgi/Chlat1/2948/Chrsp2S04682